MPRFHRAFDPAYRAAVALAMARRSARLPSSDALSQLATTVDTVAGLSDDDRKRVHAALEVDAALRAEVRATLTPDLAGPAVWLWLGRDVSHWELLVDQLLDAHDEHRETEYELEKAQRALEQRTAQWRHVMRQLSEATAALERAGAPLVQSAFERPLSDADWDEILGRDT